MDCQTNIRTSEDLEAQINDIRIKKGMTEDGFDQDELIEKLEGNEDFNYSSQGQNDEDVSESDSDEEDENNGGENYEEQIYKEKYRRLRSYIKELMFENAALCDEVASVEAQVQVYHKQRKSLLARLLRHSPTLEQQFLDWQKTKQEKTAAIQNGSNTNNDTNGTSAVPQKRKYKKRSNSDNSSSGNNNMIGKGKSTNSMSKKQRQSMNSSNANMSGASSSNTTTVENTKPVEILLNANGQPISPFTVNGFTVHSLGEIIPNKSGYYTDEFIYPAGYVVSRIYGHFRDPEKKCVYTCRIIKNGEFPKFEICANESDPSDHKLFRISGPSPDYCHTTLLQCINNVCVRSIDIRPQGENFFGLANPTIMSLIRKLPNADKCPSVIKNVKLPSHKLAMNSDATLNYDALQRHMNLSVYHTVPEIKEEPPEDLFDN
uniref:CSON013917 protein n=1 Tax=Culicoides sonorensis TaxID=179676 RepID=A0A336M929_CULSO